MAELASVDAPRGPKQIGYEGACPKCRKTVYTGPGGQCPICGREIPLGARSGPKLVPMGEPDQPVPPSSAVVVTREPKAAKPARAEPKPAPEPSQQPAPSQPPRTADGGDAAIRRRLEAMRERLVAEEESSLADYKRRRLDREAVERVLSLIG